MNNVYIYGDSIMKATLPDEKMKYHFHFAEYVKNFSDLPVNITNRAKFGAYAEKGLSIVEADLKKGIECDIALVEFGGNDCNFDWTAIAKNPKAHHDPKTILEHFNKFMTEIILKLRNVGVKPVLLTLPPINGEKYFSFITRDGTDGDNILSWLGSVDVIEQFQKLYSDAISALSEKLGVFCLDIRSYLLSNNTCDLVSCDGIHPSAFGYQLIFKKIREALECII